MSREGAACWGARRGRVAACDDHIVIHGLCLVSTASGFSCLISTVSHSSPVCSAFFCASVLYFTLPDAFPFSHLRLPPAQVLESVAPSLLHWGDPLQLRKELFRKPFASWPLSQPQSPSHAALHWKVRQAARHWEVTCCPCSA